MLLQAFTCFAIFLTASGLLYMIIAMHPEHKGHSHEPIEQDDWNDEIYQYEGQTLDGRDREKGSSTGLNIDVTASPPPLPFRLSELANLTSVGTELSYCKQEHFAYIGVLFAMAYLYKQAFAIPGSMILNLFAGTLFGFWPGFLFCCLLTTIGASVAYFLANTFGKECFLYYFGHRISHLQHSIKSSGRRLFWFLIFARIFPVSPGWLLNIAAPILDIPYGIFIVSTFFGLAPYNFIGVHAGAMLAELDSLSDVLQPKVLMQLCAVSLLPLAVAIIIGSRSTGHSRSPSYDYSSSMLTTGTNDIAGANDLDRDVESYYHPKKRLHEV